MSEILILGAGPYGLAVTAHLRAAGFDAGVFGDPMSFWSGSMPAGMLLRSPRVASSISDPHDKLDLDGFSAATGVPVGSPVPLESFVEYGRWFQAQVVPDVDRRRVERIRRSGRGFELDLADGEQATAERVTAERVIVAAGIAPFAHIPPIFRELPPGTVSHSSAHPDLRRFAGQRVLVVGGGQSALESAALLHEGGARVDVAVRAPGVHWLGQRPWLRSMGPISTLLYAPPEVGPPLVSQLVRVPGWCYRLPAQTRLAVDRRSIRPAGAGWLKARVEDVVPVRGQRVVTGVAASDAGITVTFAGGDRDTVDRDTVDRDTVDHILLATGYRVDLARYPFLAPELLAEVAQVDGYPVLGRGFESSVAGLHFVGATAAWSYGPLMRFVAGTRYTAAEVTRYLTAARRRAARSGAGRT